VIGVLDPFRATAERGANRDGEEGNGEEGHGEEGDCEEGTAKKMAAKKMAAKKMAAKKVTARASSQPERTAVRRAATPSRRASMLTAPGRSGSSSSIHLRSAPRLARARFWKSSMVM